MRLSWLRQLIHHRHLDRGSSLGQANGRGRVLHQRAVHAVAGAEMRHVVEDGKQLVVLALADWAVLVIVALRTLQRQAKPRPPGGLEPVDNALDAKLLLARVVALGLHRVPVERTGHPLLRRCARQEIAGELINRKPVERHVLVERGNHPVAVWPDVARAVCRITGRVGKPREIKPVLRLALPEMRRGEQPLNQARIALRRIVVHKAKRLIWGRRQPGQVQ